MLLWIRLIFFTILVPGMVAGYIPSQLKENGIEGWHNPFLRWLGILLIFLGVAVYLLCAIAFVLKGRGTPMIWFAKPLQFLVGKEPNKLVSSGLYKYSRNPMYLGVITTILGQTLFYEKRILLFYLLFVIILFNLVIAIIEEPHLRKKFGKEYEAYKKKTRRWL